MLRNNNQFLSLEKSISNMFSFLLRNEDENNSDEGKNLVNILLSFT